MIKIKKRAVTISQTRTRLNIFSAPMNMMTRGKIPLKHTVREKAHNIKRDPPRYHSDSEAHESADAQAGDSTDKNLNGAGEDQTNSAMNGQPFPHGLEEIDGERQVGKVDEHGKDRRVGRGRLA